MKKFIIAGGIGGILVFILLLIALIIFGAYDYAPVQILNPAIADHCLNNDKIALIQELSRNGTLLTPAEYTSHVVSYYNSIIMLLVALFAVFSFIAYFSLKSKMKEQIQESLIEMLRDSKAFDETITTNIYGKVTQEFLSLESAAQLKDEVDSLQQDMEDIKDAIPKPRKKKTIINNK